MPDSIIRRTDSLVELILDKRNGDVQSIKIQTSPDLLTWTTRKVLPAKTSPTVDSITYQTWRGKVYDKFDLSAYALRVPLFLRFRDVVSGIDDAISDIYVALEAQRGTNHFYVFEGVAPQGVSIANSATINIPAARDFSIRNTDGTNSLSIAFNSAGAEVEVAAGDTFSIGPAIRVTRILVRGSGGNVPFEIRLATEY